mgnify:FL=1
MPEAPHPVPQVPTGRAWWGIDLQGIVTKILARQFDQVMQSKPAGMDSARQLILELIAAMQKETRLPTSRIILGGFSQVCGGVIIVLYIEFFDF